MDLFDKSPPEALEVVKVQEQNFNSADWDLDLKIGFENDGGIVRVRVISVVKGDRESKQVDELFCKSKTSSDWLYFGSDVTNVTRSPESKVQSYLMSRYNSDIKWDGKIPWYNVGEISSEQIT